MATNRILVLADGLVDEPATELNGKTPLAAAATPTLDRMAAEGILGLTRPISRGMPPCRAAGLLAAMGYDPTRYWRGSAVFEAAAVGVALGPNDLAFRCDLVTTEPREDGAEMVVDAKGGRPTPEEGSAIVADLAQRVGREGLELYPVRGARNLLVWRRGEPRVVTTPAAALVDRPLAEGFPSGPGADVLQAIVDASHAVVATHPMAQRRLQRGERAPTHAWPWGPSLGVVMPPHTERYAFDGVVLTGDPLTRGIASMAGLPHRGLTVEHQDDFAGLLNATREALAARPDVIIDVPSMRRPSPARRAEAAERFDAEFLAPLVEGLRSGGDAWRLVVHTVHATPGLRGHADDPIPIVVATGEDAGRGRAQKRAFREHDALELGIFVPEADGIVDRIFRR